MKKFLLLVIGIVVLGCDAEEKKVNNSTNSKQILEALGEEDKKSKDEIEFEKKILAPIKEKAEKKVVNHSTLSPEEILSRFVVIRKYTKQKDFPLALDHLYQFLYLLKKQNSKHYATYKLAEDQIEALYYCQYSREKNQLKEKQSGKAGGVEKK